METRLSWLLGYKRLGFIGLQISFKKQRMSLQIQSLNTELMVDVAGLEKIQLTLAQIYENEDKLVRQSLTLEFT